MLHSSQQRIQKRKMNKQKEHPKTRKKQIIMPAQNDKTKSKNT